jgi:hypothetical protein
MTTSGAKKKIAAAILLCAVSASVAITTIFVNEASAGSLLGDVIPTKKKKKKKSSGSGALGGIGAVGGVLGAGVGAAAAQGMPMEMTKMFAGIASGDPAALQAFQGQVFAAVLKGVTDDIEKQNARKSVNSALQSGKPSKETFKNSKGEEVTVTTEVKEVKKEDTNCRELTTSVERNGQKVEDAGGSKEICQMKLADGTVGYPPME